MSITEKQQDFIDGRLNVAKGKAQPTSFRSLKPIMAILWNLPVPKSSEEVTVLVDFLASPKIKKEKLQQAKDFCEKFDLLSVYEQNKSTRTAQWDWQSLIGGKIEITFDDIKYDLAARREFASLTYS